jgi:hypothetical protein
MVDAPLGIAEQLLQTTLAIAALLAYPGFHLKYLHALGWDDSVYTSIPLEMLRYFKLFFVRAPLGEGETLV